MKTLGECVRIRALAAAAASETATVEVQQRRTGLSNEPFNGFLLTGPRFGLTIEEVRAEVAPAFAGVPALGFEVAFLPDECVVLKARPASLSATIPGSSIDGLLKSLKSALAGIVSAKRLAASTHLVCLDSSLNLLRRELDKAEKDEEGWSQVAAKAASGPRFVKRTEAVGGKNAFTVLGSKVKEREKERRKKEKEDVVEDWEEEMRREEESVRRAEMELRLMTGGKGAEYKDSGDKEVVLEEVPYGEVLAGEIEGESDETPAEERDPQAGSGSRSPDVSAGAVPDTEDVAAATPPMSAVMAD